MTNKDIEKAAERSTEKYVENGDLRGFRGSYRLGFIAGADWRINTAWHSNAEVPNRSLDIYYCGEAILIQAIDGKFNFGIVHYGYGYNGKIFYTVTCLDKTYSMDEIKQWAYIKDLIPNKEGEQ